MANETPEQSRSERRYLTIVFVDLVGYTHLSEELDPEDLRVLQRRYQMLSSRVMERFGGFVAQFTGDGILVYFGYPIAHENDAERALRASLELIERLGTIDTRLPEASLPPLQARIGIHTGLVLVARESGTGGPAEHNVFGEVINIAARLLTEAPANGVVVSKDTLDLVAGQFEAISLGTRPVRGISRQFLLFQVIRSRPGAPRSTPRFVRGATSMIGRGDALASILRRWSIARQDNRCQTVSVVGEGGVGKTRLIRELFGQPELADTVIIRLNCHEIFSATPLYPLGSFLWAWLGLTAEDGAAIQQRKIAMLLDEFAMNTPLNQEIIGSLLGLAVSGLVAAEAPTPLMFKRKQYDIAISMLRWLARTQAMVLWIDDAHWLDPSSAEVLSEIVAAMSNMPLLLLFTARSFPRGPTLPEADETVLLEQLDDRTCQTIARAIPGAEALSDETISRAVEAAEGVPLFLEQFVISLIEEAQQAPPARPKRSGVPLMLAEMMSERLDRRPGGRRIVQAAACIGRSFTPDFLAAMLDQTSATVVPPLESLVEAELLLPRRYGAEIRYEFRHALLQRMAYESVAQTDRRAMHERIVVVLRTEDQSRPTPHEIRAHHLTEAGHFEEAIEAWLQAGLSAARRFADIEAIEHLRRGLSLLGKLPENAPSRRNLELNIQAALMASTLTTEGATSSRVSECCRRGLELCQQGEPSTLELAFAYGQFTYANCRGHIDESHSLAQLFLSLAERSHSQPGLAMGHLMLGRYMLGEARIPEALEHFNRALALCSPHGDGGATTQMFGQHIDVHVKAGLSTILACQGKVDQAIELGLDAMRTADRLRHPHSTAIPLAWVGGNTFWVLGAADEEARQSERLIALAEEHRFASFRAMGTAHLGAALCQRGDLAAAITALEDAVASLDRIDFLLVMSKYLGHLADAQRRLGRLDAAERNCRRAIEIMRETSSLWIEPELRRIEALIVAQRTPDQPERAAAMLRDAAACARGLGFPTMERWCLLSLREHLGPNRRDTDIDSRLAGLAHLADAAERVAARMQHVARGL